jgi:inosine-uridine nucleoside N-ribohydrolase
MRYVALLVLTLSSLIAEPVRLIFDTDMGNDIDDALALAVIHALESRGEAKLLAVTITKDNPWAAPYVDLVNHFYGRAEIPVGVVKNGKTPGDSAYIRVPSERRNPSGGLLYPRKITDGRDAPDAVEVLRQVLEKQPDHSVAMVQVGFSTNLARLLASAGGKQLIQRKVRLLSIMAGQFPSGRPEYNVRVDIPAAQAVFRDWPTPIVASGFEIGEAILYPARSIEQDYGYVKDHPIADGYRNYRPMPYNRPAWDLTSVLYAVRPERGYFSVSQPGWIRVDEEGRTSLESDPAGKHRYLLVDELQKAQTLEALVQLASQPPGP